MPAPGPARLPAAARPRDAALPPRRGRDAERPVEAPAGRCAASGFLIVLDLPAGLLYEPARLNGMRQHP
jgi:hypothetical protein